MRRLSHVPSSATRAGYASTAPETAVSPSTGPGGPTPTGPSERICPAVTRPLASVRISGLPEECDAIVAGLRAGGVRVVSARARRKRDTDTGDMILMDVETR